MTTSNGLPPSLYSFIRTISGRTKFPKFYKLWVECTHEETRIAARERLHGTQPEENQAFVSHTKKGKGRGRKPYIHKHQDKRTSPPPYQKKQRRIYLRSNAIGAKSTIIMPIVVEVLTKGSMKLQLLM